MLSRATTTVDPYTSARRGEQVVVFLGGHNDLAGGASAASVIDNIAAYVAARAAYGIKTILVTIPPTIGADSTFDASRETIANWMVGSSGCPTADLRVIEAQLLDPANHASGGADSVHFNDAGYSLIAGVVAPVVQGMLS
jgi:lysophospholipase L1-like esterase